MSRVIVVIGAGSIGQAIARRVSVGKQVLLADLRPENAQAAAEVFSNAGYQVTTATVDVSSSPSIFRILQIRIARQRTEWVYIGHGISAPHSLCHSDQYLSESKN